MIDEGRRIKPVDSTFHFHQRHEAWRHNLLMISFCRMEQLAPPENGKQGFLETLIHKSTDVGELLREDDSLLRMCFTQIIQKHHPRLASKLNVIYALSASWGQDASDTDFEMLEKKLSELTPEEMILVCIPSSSASCFARMLCLRSKVRIKV